MALGYNPFTDFNPYASIPSNWRDSIGAPEFWGARALAYTPGSLDSQGDSARVNILRKVFGPQPETSRSAGEFRPPSPYDASKPVEAYRPSVMDEYLRMLQNPPEREPISWKRRIGAGLLGATQLVGRNPDSAAANAITKGIIEGPYQRKLEDYQRRLQGLGAGAQFEAGRIDAAARQESERLKNLVEQGKLTVEQYKASLEALKVEIDKMRAGSEVTRSSTLNKLDEARIREIDANIAKGDISDLREVNGKIYYFDRKTNSLQEYDTGALSDEAMERLKSQLRMNEDAARDRAAFMRAVIGAQGRVSAAEASGRGALKPDDEYKIMQAELQRIDADPSLHEVYKDFYAPNASGTGFYLTPPKVNADEGTTRVYNQLRQRLNMLVRTEGPSNENLRTPPWWPGKEINPPAPYEVPNPPPQPLFRPGMMGAPQPPTQSTPGINIPPTVPPRGNVIPTVTPPPGIPFTRPTGTVPPGPGPITFLPGGRPAAFSAPVPPVAPPTPVVPPVVAPPPRGPSIGARPLTGPAGVAGPRGNVGPTTTAGAGVGPRDGISQPLEGTKPGPIVHPEWYKGPNPTNYRGASMPASLAEAKIFLIMHGIDVNEQTLRNAMDPARWGRK